MNNQEIQKKIDGLEKVAKLLEQGWTKGVMARDSRGITIDPQNSEAVCWCLVGACIRAGGPHTESLIAELGQVIRGPISHANDSFQYPREAIEFTKKAIQRLRGRLNA